MSELVKQWNEQSSDGNRKRSLPLGLVILGLLSVAAWMGLFACGISMDVSKFVDEMNPSHPDNVGHHEPTLDQLVRYWRYESIGMLPHIPPQDLVRIPRQDMDDLLKEVPTTEYERILQLVVLANQRKARDGNTKPQDAALDAVQHLAGSESIQRTTALKPELTAPSLREDEFDMIIKVRLDSEKPVEHEAGASEMTSPTFASPPSALVRVGHFFAVLGAHTALNLGLLSCLASVMGGLYRAVTVKEAGQVYNFERIVADVIQGFIMYLAVLAGLLVIGEVPLEHRISFEKYVRIAGAISVLSFWAGYTPGDFFTRMIGNGAGKASGASKA